MSLEETLCKHGINAACYCYECKWEVKEQLMKLPEPMPAKSESNYQLMNGLLAKPENNVLYIPKDLPLDTSTLKREKDQRIHEAQVANLDMYTEFIKRRGWTQVLYRGSVVWCKFTQLNKENKEKYKKEGYILGHLLHISSNVYDCVDIEEQSEIQQHQQNMADNGSFIGEAS